MLPLGLRSFLRAQALFLQMRIYSTSASHHSAFLFPAQSAHFSFSPSNRFCSKNNFKLSASSLSATRVSYSSQKSSPSNVFLQSLFDKSSPFPNSDRFSDLTKEDIDVFADECLIPQNYEVHDYTYLDHPESITSEQQQHSHFNSSSQSGFGMVLLNSPLGELFSPAWSAATCRICADGGANRLYDNYTSDEDRITNRPLAIVGDLDSVRPDVLKFYAAHGVDCVRISDDSKPDAEKALLFLAKKMTLPHHLHNSDPPHRCEEDGHESKSEAEWGQEPVACPRGGLLLFGALSGRFDHQIAAIHALYKYTSLFPRLQIVADGNSVELLNPGRHRIICSGKYQVRI